MSQPKFLVGIDPGRSTGICIYDRQKKKVIELKTYDFWNTITLLSNFRKYMGGLMDDDDKWKVILEDPQLNKPVFFPANRKMNDRTRLKKAQDVGRNKENAFLLTEFLIYRKIDHKIIRPTTQKWDAEFFKKVTGYTGESNQHVRDAAKLTIGY